MKSIQITLVLIISFCFGFSYRAAGQGISEENAKMIQETALNYGDGFLSGSGERMTKALFPDLRKYSLMSLPNTSLPVLIQSSYSGLIQMSAAQVGLLEESARKIEVQALGQFADQIACARLTSSQFNDYLHMVKENGVWKIVNILWAPGPGSRNRSIVPVLSIEEQKPLILNAVANFYEGIYSGKADLIRGVLHPNFTLAKWTSIGPKALPYLSRDGADLLTAVADGKLALVEESKRESNTELLDYMDGMATVQVTSPAGTVYLHLGYIDSKWQLVHMLQYAPPRVR